MRTKRVLWIAGIAVVVMAVGVVVAGVWVVRTGLHRLMVEDMIVHGGEELVVAIERYVAEHGGPPGTLEDLVPGTLAALPEVEFVERVAYRVEPGGVVWSLHLFSSELGPVREFVYRSTGETLPAEADRVTGGVHGWTVLRLPDEAATP